MWCRTCGKDTPEGVVECDVCKQWWKDNEPMNDREMVHFVLKFFLSMMFGFAVGYLMVKLLG